MFSGGMDEFITCLAEAFQLTNTLFVSLFKLMISETSLTSEMSITVRARDSNLYLYTWRTGNAIATCLVTCVHDVAFAPLAACFTHKALGHGTCHAPYHMIMPRHIII
jgi:hypothetical protein